MGSSKNKITLQELKKKRDDSFLKKDWQGVLDSVEGMIKIKPGPKRYCNHAYALLQLGQVAEALASYKRALDLRPGYAAAKKGVKKAYSLLRSLEESINEERKQLNHQIKKHVEQKHWGNALHDIDLIIAKNPTANDYCNRAFVLIKQGKLQKAMRSYNKALSLDPNFINAQKGIKKVKKMIMKVADATKEEAFLRKDFAKKGNWHNKVLVIAIIALSLTVWLVLSLYIEKKSFSKACMEDSINSYESYLQKYPKGQFVEKVELLIAKKQFTHDLIETLEFEQQEEYSKAISGYRKTAYTLSKYRDKLTSKELKKIFESRILKKYPFQNRLIFEEVEDFRKKITSLRKKSFIKNQLARGFVQYKGNWMTPGEKLVREKLAQGFVEYNGKWMTPEEKFIKEKLAQGLVKYNGNWMTPEEKFIKENLAQGLVKYNGKWMTPEEKLLKKSWHKVLLNIMAIG